MKKGFIIGIVAVLSLVALGFVGIRYVNSKIEDKLVNIIDDNIKYEELSVSALKGTLLFNGLEFTEENNVLGLDYIEFKIPLGNVISLVKDVNNGTITNIKITIRGVKISNQLDSYNYEQDSLMANIKGKISTKIFTEGTNTQNTDLLLNGLEMDNNGVQFISENGNIDIDNLYFDLKGNLDFRDFEYKLENEGYGVLKDIFESLSLNFQGFKYEADDKMIQSLTMMAYMFLGDVSIIQDEKNWEVDKLLLELQQTENTLIVDELDLVTNWIDLNVNGLVTLDEDLESFTPLQINVTMNDYIDDLRPLFEMVASGLSEDLLPVGPFVLNISIEDDNSYPLVKIKELD